MQVQGYMRRRKAQEPLPDITLKMAAIRGRQCSVHYAQGWPCIPCVSKDGVQDFEVQPGSDVKGSAKTYFSAWKS